MDYLLLLQSESDELNLQLVLSGILEALANVILMATAIAAANGDSESFSQAGLAVIFCACLLVFLFFRARLLNSISRNVEGIVRKIRMRISTRIRRAELATLESVGRPAILQALAQDCQTLYDAASDILIACGQVAVLVCSIAYIGVLSLNAFWCIGIALIAALFVLARYYRSIQAGFEAARNEEQNLFNILNDQLAGFKELSLHTDKADEFYRDDIIQSARRSEQLKLTAAIQINYGNSLAQGVFFVLLGIIIFILPKFMEPNASSALMVSKIVAVFLFIDAPLELIARNVPAYTRANVAARRIAALDSRLSELIKESEEAQTQANDFDHLRCKNVVFRFPALPNHPQDAFQIGPLNLEVRRGEIIFLCGGNGSGKSTLLNLLCGLLSPSSGQIVINDRVTTTSSRAQFRAYFTVVLQDFHLFSRLLGRSRGRLAQARTLLKTLRLDGVTALDDEGRFSNLHLSAGQRKRLALLVSECDEREILLLDEWAADQDPEFRRYFYEEYLPALSARGKTVIAATHDDQYFHIADRLLRMDRGCLTELPHTARARAIAGDAGESPASTEPASAEPPSQGA